MATLLKPVRLANPRMRGIKRKGRRRVSNSSGKRRMTLKQKLHFGSARQRAAAKVALGGHRKRRANSSVRKTLKRLSKSYPMESVKKRGTQRKHPGVKGMWRKYYRKKSSTKIGNVGEIMTIALGSNPGSRRKRKSNSKRRTNSNYMARHRKASRRRRAVASAPRRRRRHNPSIRRTMKAIRRRGGSTAYTRRRLRRAAYSTSSRRRGYRRHNPGFGGMFAGGGTLSTAFGVIGGAAVTKLIIDRLPAGLNSGIVGYLTAAVVATLQGTLIGKLLRNPSLGKNMQIGGYTYLGLRLISDFAPGISLPFGLKGMGIITPSNFYVPQATTGNSLTSFVTPAGISAALPPPVSRTGMGRVTQMARVGRMG